MTHSPGPWRTGRKVGRTIYDANDCLIGVMDKPEDARLAAAAPELLAMVRTLARHSDDEAGQEALALIRRIEEG